MEYILYKNNRKFSNIKFSSIDTIKEYIEFIDTYTRAEWHKYVYDVYEYPTGKFYCRLMVKTYFTSKGTKYGFVEITVTNKPRNRRFKKN